MIEKEQVNLEVIEKEFEHVIGYKSIKNEMIKICDIMRNSEFYSKLGVSVPNGLLISGDPGLGKTLMANCFIKASGRKAFTCRKDKPDGDFVNHIKSTFDEAVKILEDKEEYIQHSELGFRNITSKGEKALMKHFNGVVWLTNFDVMAVPFYQATTDNGRLAKNADLLFGIGETVGSGERHATGEEVRKSLEIHKVREEEYKWYIELKDKFPMKTSGFGMGIERFILWLTKKDDIRDCQILPRFIGKNIVP